MSLSARVKKLEEAAPPARRSGRALPEEAVAFARGLLVGDLTAEDIDPCHPEHSGWLARAVIFLGTLQPEHQAWLRLERERDPRSYPGELLLPAPDEEVMAALDEVMRIHPARVRSWMVKFSLRDGPRAEGSGRCAETVRRLRALFPAEPAVA